MKKTYGDNVIYPTKEAMRACIRGGTLPSADNFISQRAKPWHGVSQNIYDSEEACRSIGFIPKEILADLDGTKEALKVEQLKEVERSVLDIFADGDFDSLVPEQLLNFLEVSYHIKIRLTL